MKTGKNYKKKNYNKKKPFDKQQSIDFANLRKFLETNSNEQNKKNDNKRFLYLFNNPQGTKNNSKQFDKESSFDDDMVNFKGDLEELSQEDMFDISGTSSSFDDILNDMLINGKNDDELFNDVFNNPQDDSIDFSEFNKKGTKNILIEDNGDKTRNIAALYNKAIQKSRKNKRLNEQETDVIRLINDCANILDENDKSTHKKTNQFLNKAKYNDNKQYPLENNTLYQGFNMSKYDIQKNKSSNNNNYKNHNKNNTNWNNPFFWIFIFFYNYCTIIIIIIRIIIVY